MKKVVLAVTAASGMPYTKVLLEKLQGLNDQWQEVALVFSKNAEKVWHHENPGIEIPDNPFKRYAWDDFFAPFASGSASYDTMIVCPCTMGTLGRIASGVSNDLISRAADVMLKERRKLILVSRESPYNLIQIKNMQKVTEAGGIICPANPGFYNQPKSLDDLLSNLVDRVLKLAGFHFDSYEWNT